MLEGDCDITFEFAEPIPAQKRSSLTWVMALSKLARNVPEPACSLEELQAHVVAHVSPKRDHTSEFDLLSHLEANRPGQYRFLSVDEAVSRLPPAKGCAPNAGEAEMAKRPAQCLTCGVYLHFPYVTNDIALKL